MNLIGHRMYSLASFILRVANGGLSSPPLEPGTPILEAAPKDISTQGLSCHQEAMGLAKQEQIVSRHVPDMASKQLATAVSLCRHAWLQSAGISDDVRTRIEDLPFDGIGLSDEKTDDILDNLLKLRKPARSYSTQQSHAGTSWHRPYQSRDFQD